MPNCCHDTLTISGAEDELARFVSAAKTDEQPLSFDAIIPEPSDEEYREMERAIMETCDLCAGKGKRPVTQKEADAWGCKFHPGVCPELPFEDRKDCNGCSGTGERVPIGGEAWYNWRCENW